MPYPYIHLHKEQYRTGVPKYILDEKVIPGHILQVKHLGVYSSAIAANDTLQLGLFDGANYIPLHSKYQPTAVLTLAHHCDFPLPQGYQIYGYFDNIAAGETVELAVLGEMYTVDEWNRAHGLVKE